MIYLYLFGTCFHFIYVFMIIGNKARLFSNSPRIALFENAKIPDVRERLVSIEGLKEMQDKQIAFLASLLQ